MGKKYYLTSFNATHNGNSCFIQLPVRVIGENPRLDIIGVLKVINEQGFSNAILLNVWELTESEYERYREMTNSTEEKKTS